MTMNNSDDQGRHGYGGGDDVNSGLHWLTMAWCGVWHLCCESDDKPEYPQVEIVDIETRVESTRKFPGMSHIQNQHVSFNY